MIYLPPPQPVLNQDIRVSGDVEIHPTASIAPGVILQAAANHRIVIGADVCIGMGVIINAGEGSVEIGNGAILGSGVLIFGKSKIGNNACVGTAVTVFQTDIEEKKVVEPGAILGDTSRPAKDLSGDRSEHPTQETPLQSYPNSQNASRAGKNYYFSSQKPHAQDEKFVENKPQKESSKPTPNATSTETTIELDNSNKKDKEAVVGQVYINQLLVTLFPHNKDLNSDNKKLK